MNETKQNLIERWTTNDRQLLVKAVTSHISNRRQLENLKEIQMIDNRFDLRGISFPKEHTDYNYKGKQIRQIVGSLKFKNISIENVDFSYADIQQTKWKNCRFKNVKFHSTQMEQVTIVNCDFENVEFINTRLSYSHLNIRSGKKSGSFKNVVFKNAKLNETRFSFPAIENCSFEDCNLYAADFDGSRFRDCRFKGEVNSPWFRRHSINEFEPNYFLNQIDKSKFVNEMENVDFSTAILKYVTFAKDLDLSKCKFAQETKLENSPADDKYLYAMSE